MRRWFSPDFWRYCLGKRPSSGMAPWPQTVWCRAKGHPKGEIYYNPGGQEPDHRCKGCGEEI